MTTTKTDILVYAHWSGMEKPKSIGVFGISTGNKSRDSNGRIKNRKDGLALNIDTENNALDFELAKSVGGYFQLSDSSMATIIHEVQTVVSSWEKIAQKIGISRSEMEMMASAFRS
jgi:hypothetical protein